MPRCVSSLLTTPVLGSPVHSAGYVTAYHSKPRQLRSPFDPCCYPYFQACHFLTSLEHSFWISSNPRGAGLSGCEY
ncbi:hypothetical protein EDB86DRAFT_2881240 [Lactarius hatsudake]|nr:hypothetical protein EDB86DRAFT_2881240 [Lactarius hatsudake]